MCQARWYDPVTGRWGNRDPIGYAGGANLYGYCGGGVVGGADPWGLQFTTVDGVDLAADVVGVFDPFGVVDLIHAITYGARGEWGNAGLTILGILPVLGDLAKIPKYGKFLAKTAKVAEPVAELAKGSKLNRNLAAAGRGVVKGLEHGHHIVALNAKKAKEAREVLKKFGIGIDDACNGVGLGSSFHRGLHTDEYYDWINRSLAGASSRSEAENILLEIAEQLRRRSGN